MSPQLTPDETQVFFTEVFSENIHVKMFIFSEIFIIRSAFGEKDGVHPGIAHMGESATGKVPNRSS